MFVSAGTLEPLALKTSAVSASLASGRCELHVPYTGTLTPQSQAAVTSTLRRLMIQMRYGTRLKGLHVSADDQILTVSPVASDYTLQQWLDSGELVAAVEKAFRVACPSAAR